VDVAADRKATISTALPPWMHERQSAWPATQSSRGKKTGCEIMMQPTS